MKSFKNLENQTGVDKLGGYIVIAVILILVLIALGVSIYESSRPPMLSPGEEPTCQDGTVFGECSSSGQICFKGNLILSCANCKCDFTKISIEKALLK